MFPLLIIGLVWLLLTAVMCVLIGRAIRNADVHDEEQAQREWADAGRARVPDAILGGRAPGSLCTLHLPELDFPEFPGDGRRGPTALPRKDPTAGRPDVQRNPGLP
jgi:hypothetical protein